MINERPRGVKPGTTKKPVARVEPPPRDEPDWLPAWNCIVMFSSLLTAFKAADAVEVERLQGRLAREYGLRVEKVLGVEMNDPGAVGTEPGSSVF